MKVSMFCCGQSSIISEIYVCSLKCGARDRASSPAAVGDAAHEALHAVPALRRGAHQPPHAVHHAAARQGDAEVGHGDTHLHTQGPGRYV